MLALSSIAPSRSSVVKMKSMGQLHLLKLVGLANCEKRNFCCPSTPTHFLISTELDNMVCKRLLFSLSLTDNSMYSTPGTEICKLYEDVLCSRNCLTNRPLPHCSLTMIIFSGESWCLSWKIQGETGKSPDLLFCWKGDYVGRLRDDCGKGSLKLESWKSKKSPFSYSGNNRKYT